MPNAVRISQLDQIEPGKRDADLVKIPGNDNVGKTVWMSPRDVVATLALTLTGPITGTGLPGGTLATSIGGGTITISKHAPLAARSMIANPTSSVAQPRAVKLSDDDFVFVGDELHVSAAANASDASPLLDYERFGSGIL